MLFRTASGDVVDLAKLTREQLKPLRAQMQMIFQDPYGSLNPRMTLFDIVGEPLLIAGMRNRKQREERVAELLRLVGLRPEFMQRFPHAFSGGQRQRIGIARALALNPRLVVADEPVSALDVSVQAQTLNLMLDLQQRLNLTYLFVSHNLSVVKHICDRVTVMYVGKIVETATSAGVCSPGRATRTPPRCWPRCPLPIRGSRRATWSCPARSPARRNPPSGCYFHPRCTYCIDRCKTEAPAYREITPGHYAACHRAEELNLAGMA